MKPLPTRRTRTGRTSNNGCGFLECFCRESTAALYEGNSIGFRVASAVLEPASVGLLTLGGLALLKRRRR